jgi:uncharacterized membrane protein YuzA (DUF378 family)
MESLSIFIRIAMVIAGIGAINWGLSLLKINAVTIITAGNTTYENIIYGIVAFFGLVSVIGAFLPH